LGRELLVKRESTLNADGWPVIGEPVEVATGSQVTVTTECEGGAAAMTSSVLPTAAPELAAMCHPGDQLFVGRYLVNGAETSSLYLEVTAVDAATGAIACVALNDATLSGQLTIIHSDASSGVGGNESKSGGGEKAFGGMSSTQAEQLPLFAPTDLPALKEIAESRAVDFVALTYTCSAEDVATAREAVDALGLSGTKLIAKVENRLGLDYFAGIAEAADAVALSRGNLGMDIPAPKMAAVQKAAIAACNLLGKPCVLTRLVDTMVSAPRCTRAEATDVANAVLDGVDALMLGAETLRGAYPAETVRTVLSIARQAELAFDHASHFDGLMEAVSSDAVVGEVEAAAAQATAAGMKKVSSFGSIPRQAPGVTDGSIPSRLNFASGNKSNNNYHGAALPKVEAMASTAVRAAEKIDAALLIVFAYTGRTTSLVAKYRPKMPVFTVVVPSADGNGSNSSNKDGSSMLERQFNLLRGVLPATGALAAAGEGATAISENMLVAAVRDAAARGLLVGGDPVVAVMQHRGDLVLKIAAADATAQGLCPRGGAESTADLVALSAAA
jgi:pyruvate kinase